MSIPHLIVTRNGLAYTKRCLESIKRENVFVLDNGSTDGTQRYLRAHPIVQGVDGRFSSLAAAWNYGLTCLFAFSSGKHSHVLVLNNDTELLPHTARELHQEMLSYDDRCNVGILSGVSVRSPKELFKPKFFFPPSNHPDFSCFLISKSCWEAVGKFDESFLGAYCEDCDYHIRMHKAGWKALSINLPFLHHGSGTIQAATDEERAKIHERAESNRDLLFKKWGVRPGTKEYEGLFK